MLVTRLSYDSNTSKKAEIHVDCFPEQGIITEPGRFLKHTTVPGVITAVPVTEMNLFWHCVFPLSLILNLKVVGLVLLIKNRRFC